LNENELLPVLSFSKELLRLDWLLLPMSESLPAPFILLKAMSSSLRLTARSRLWQTISLLLALHMSIVVVVVVVEVKVMVDLLMQVVGGYTSSKLLVNFSVFPTIYQLSKLIKKWYYQFKIRWHFMYTLIDKLVYVRIV